MTLNIRLVGGSAEDLEKAAANLNIKVTRLDRNGSIPVLYGLISTKKRKDINLAFWNLLGEGT